MSADIGAIWQLAEKIADTTQVDEALLAFEGDPTGDNATGVVAAVLREAAKAQNEAREPLPDEQQRDAQEAPFEAREPLHIGASITDGRLYVTVMQCYQKGRVYVRGSAEMDVEMLTKHDCVAQVTQPEAREPLLAERDEAGKVLGVRVGHTLYPEIVVRAIERAHRIGIKAEPPEASEPMTDGQKFAQYWAHAISAEQEFFSANKHIDRIETRRVFERGFKYGWAPRYVPQAQPEAGQLEGREPLGYMSPAQVERINDPEGEFGVYIPMRRTPAGNFTMPLYAAPQPAPTASGASHERRNWNGLATRRIEELEYKGIER